MADGRELPDGTAEIEASGLFGEVTARLFDWEISYTADEYIRLLDTFSGHLAMEAWQRDRLYGEIRRRLAERPDGRLRRHGGAVLRVARRRQPPSTAGNRPAAASAISTASGCTTGGGPSGGCLPSGGSCGSDCMRQPCQPGLSDPPATVSSWT